jgi:hypothetical protein
LFQKFTHVFKAPVELRSTVQAEACTHHLACVGSASVIAELGIVLVQVHCPVPAALV